MTVAYLIHLANYSDGVLYALAALLLVALAVMLDRFWFLRRTILRGGRLVAEVGAHAALGLPELAALRDKAGALPEGALLATGHDHMDLKFDALESRLDETIMLIAPRLDGGLWVLDTIVTLSPLLGLFGTILGMFHAFSVLAVPGHAPTAVTGGVDNALVATASGIFIAMFGLVAFNALSNRVRLVIHQLDTLKTMVMNRCTPGTTALRPGAGGGIPSLHAVAAGE